jgi:molybdate/tungstate transport system substrate-binding protein
MWITTTNRISRLRRLVAMVLTLLVVMPVSAAAQDVGGPLVVYNAGSLAVPFKLLLDAFTQRNPDVRVQQEHSGSLAAVRKLTELDRIPDVLALADVALFPALLQPEYTSWHAVFARNSMVLAVSPLVPPNDRGTADNWPDVLLDESVRWGHADPAVDPAGYRTFMVFDLAERHYGRPGLGRALRDRSEPRYTRPKSADLVALLQLGELDYAWLYSSVARFHDLPYVALPDSVNLSAPQLADVYNQTVVRVPGRTGAPGDTIEVRGRAIELAASVPRAAPHPEVARAFFRFLVSTDGQAVLRQTGLLTVDPPEISGTPPSGLLP